MRHHVMLGFARQADEMVEDVRTAFIQNTRQLSWMDDETRLNAEDKAEAITRMMGESNRLIHQSRYYT